MLKVRDLLDLFSADIKEMAAKVNKVCDTPVKAEVDVEDKGFPVKGQCSVPFYPVYVSPISTRGSEGFVINPFEKLLDFLPGEQGRIGDGRFFTPAPDLRGWMLIDKEKISSTAHKEQVVGDFEVWLDWRAPNKDQELKDVGPLMRDFILRADTRGVVDKTGYQYMDIGQVAEDDTDDVPIMVLTRVDCAITFNVRTCEWEMFEDAMEPSAINNVTQHKELLTTVKEGRATYTGEEIAKMVMSTEKGLGLLADWYDKNLDTILLPTRFAITHPLDARGYFLRKSATAAVNVTGDWHIPTKDMFPVYIHDIALDHWFGISNGLAQISVGELPPSREQAGVLMGVYEVWYDKEAKDVYTNAQLGWLLKTVMGSRFMPTSEGHVAMFGCMAYLNHFIAKAVHGGVVKQLDAVPGTRIADLSRRQENLNDFRAAFSINNPVCRVHLYDSSLGTVRMVPGHINTPPVSIVAESDNYTATPSALCNMLIAMSSAGMFSNWEANLQGDDDLEVVPPGPAYAAFYGAAPHIGPAPYALSSDAPVYLDTSEGLFGLCEDGHWGLCMEPAETTIKRLNLRPVGEYFGFQLYCDTDSNQVIQLSNWYVNNLIYSTAEYFVPFERYPTVFAYIYNLDKDSQTWMNTGIAPSNNRVTFGNNHVLSYDVETHLWECVPSAGFVGRKVFGNGITYNDPPTELTFTPEELKIALDGLQLLLPTISYSEFAQVPTRLEYPRYVADRAPETSWTLDFGGLNYTSHEGDWALSEMEVHGDARIDMLDFIELVLGWLVSFANYHNAGQGLKVIQEMLGTEDFASDACHVELNQFIVYLDGQHAYVMGEGLDDGSGLESYTTGRLAPSGGIHPVHLAVRGDCAAVPLSVAAQVLCNITAAQELMLMYENEKRSPAVAAEGAAAYLRRVQAPLDSANRLAMSEVKSKRPAILAFNNDGDMFGWTGREFYKLDTLDGFVKVGSPFDCDVCYRDGMADSPMSIDDLKYVFYRLLSVAWQSWRKADYSCILNDYILGRYRKW